MYTYTAVQWLLFFYIYCFFGWCFESAYVSAKEKQFVNRGFLKGPFLPIYGSGAIIVLLAALPFRTMPVAVYFAGLLAATLLEFVTGVAMEKLFKVRYWDYSYKKFQYKGHICLSSSIAWGFFSVAMIYGFHNPIERWVLGLPDWLVKYGTGLLTVFLAGDFATSFKTAMELRDLLVAVEKAKNELRLMQKRAEVIEAILLDEAMQRKEQIAAKKEELVAESKEQLRKELQELKNKQLMATGRLRQKLSVGRDKLELLRRNPSARSVKEYSLSFDFVKSGFHEMYNGWKLKEESVRDRIVDNMVDRIVDLKEKYKK
ncbi:MAG: hypothetical protein E7294_14295 [Lachnospiraceae bacterium]|jgi:uncharacterized membrane protein|nr:hypothetical protein [Lachnospiraceae bacterium]